MSEYGAATPPPYGSMPPGQAAGGPPQNYLVWAILTTVLCCLPVGVVSIVFAAQVNGKWAAGDFAGAQESSRKAKLFSIWAAITGVVLGVLMIIAQVALFSANS